MDFTLFPSLSRWLLAGISVCLLGLQMVFWSRMPFDEARFTAMAALVVAFMLWERRASLALESGRATTFLGLILIFAFVFEAAMSPGEIFLSVAPILWGAGLCLLAAGFGGFRTFHREWIILVFLVFPPLLRSFLFDAIGFDLSPTTASAATWLLRVCGQDASAHDVVVRMPSATVTVYSECSGLKSISFLFGLGILFLLLFPPAHRRVRWLVLPAAILIAFGVNMGRVALLAVLAGTGQEGTFEYWHKRAGAPVFEVIAVALFVVFYRAVGQRFAHATSEPPASRI